MLGALTAVVAPAFLIIGVGIVVGRAISTDLVAVNRLNLWAATPALIFHSLSTSDSLGGLGRVVLGYALFLAVMGLLAWLTSGRFSGQRQRNYVGLSLFVNSGNMMLPISLRAGPRGLDRWAGVLECAHEQALGVRAAVERGCRAGRTEPVAVPAYTLSGVLRPRLACLRSPL